LQPTRRLAGAAVAAHQSDRFGVAVRDANVRHGSLPYNLPATGQSCATPKVISEFLELLEVRRNLFAARIELGARTA
jgi:hypothetical protein